VIPGIRIQLRVGTLRSPDADAAARRVNARLRGYCAVFKGRPRGRARRRGRGAPAGCAGLSKLNSMRRARARRYAELARSGLVDVPGRSGVAAGVEPTTTKVAGAPGRVSDRVPLWNSLERR
jgi:hypothetical protein